MLKSIGLIALAALSLSAATFSASGANAATEVELKNMAAQVIVTVEDRKDVKLTVSYGTSDLPKIRLTTRGNKLIANGGLKMKNYGCQADRSVKLWGKGAVPVANLPVIYLRVPLDAKIASKGAVYGRVSNARSLELALGGCGDWQVGNVTQRAALAVGGSGNIKAGDLGSADIAIGGSGDVFTRRIGGLKAAIGGSGAISVAELQGPADISIGGAGDVRIDKGYAPRISISIAGSGDVRFAGEARDVSLALVGAGDISIRKATGRVSKSILGSGDIHIGQ